MTAKIYLSNEENIIERYKNGDKVINIAKDNSCTTKIINNLLRSKNIERRKTPIDKSLSEQIIKRYLDGESTENIAKDFGCHKRTISDLIKDNNIQFRNKLYNKNESWLDEINTESKAYFLGIMVTDGTVNKRENSIKIALQKRDEIILKKFSMEILNEDKIAYEEKRSEKHQDMAVLRFSSERIKQNLEKYGIVPNKTFITQYPPNIPRHLHRHVLRGIVDGDGHIGINSNGKTRLLVSGMDSLMKGMEEVINNTLNFDIFFNIRRDRNIFNLEFRRLVDKYILLKLLYNDCDYYLPRKLELSKEALKILEESQLVKDYIQTIQLRYNLTVDQYISCKVDNEIKE